MCINVALSIYYKWTPNCFFAVYQETKKKKMKRKKKTTKYDMEEHDDDSVALDEEEEAVDVDDESNNEDNDNDYIDKGVPLALLVQDVNKEHSTRSSETKKEDDTVVDEVIVNDKAKEAAAEDIVMTEDNINDCEEMEDEDETPTKAEDPEDKEMIKTYTDIKGLRYYDDDTYVTSVPALMKQIDANNADPTDGVPEQLFWVAYKRGKTGNDIEIPWTAILIDNKQQFLDKWIKERKPKSKQLKSFPRDVEDYAIGVYQKIHKDTKTNKGHMDVAKALYKKWTEVGRV